VGFQILRKLCCQPERRLSEDEPLAELKEAVVPQLDLPAVALAVTYNPQSLRKPCFQSDQRCSSRRDLSAGVLLSLRR
jgi:hypothetical protein